MSRETAPSWSDLTALVAAIGKQTAVPPAPPPETSTGKWLLALLGSLLVVFLGGLGTWAGSTIAGVGSLGPKIDALKTNVDDLKTKLDTISTQSNQQQLAIGKQDLRLTTVEQNQARLMDRMRAVEGGPRIASPAPGAQVQP